MPHDANNPHKADALSMLEEFVRLHGSNDKARERVGVDPLVQAAVSTVAQAKLPGDLVLDLHDLHLQKAKLPGAHLEGAHLHGACLEEANLQDAHLEKANLSSTRLWLAKLQGAHLERAILHDARLLGAYLSSARLEGADLSFAQLGGADLLHANLVEANLSSAHLKGTNIAGVDFHQVTGLSQEQLNTAIQRPDDPRPKRLPNGLNWDEEAAKARWQEQAIPG